MKKEWIWKFTFKCSDSCFYARFDQNHLEVLIQTPPSVFMDFLAMREDGAASRAANSCENE
jgi:hypothetical protein